MRRIVFAAAVALTGVSGGLLMASPAAHADSGGCASVYLNVNGSDLVNQQVCTPATPAPPPLPAPPAVP